MEKKEAMFLPKLKSLVESIQRFVLNIQEKTVDGKLATMVSIFALLSFLLLVIYKWYCTLTVPFVEVREMANIVAIESIQNGILNNINFYPDNIYLYGTLQAWLLSFFSNSLDPLMLNRNASLVCLVLSVIPLLFAIKDCCGKQKPSVYFLATCIYFVPFLYQTPVTHGTPNYMGLLFANLTLLLSLKRNIVAIMLIPCCLVACYFTKQYHLFAFCYIFCSCLFLKRALWGISIIIFVILATGIGIYLGCLSEQAQYAFTHHLIMKGNQRLLSMVSKYADFLLIMAPLLWLILSSFVCHFSNKKTDYAFDVKSLWQRIKGVVFPSTRNQFFVYSLAITVLAFLIMLRMGQHQGAIGFMYFSQLLAPALLLFTFIYAQKVKLHKNYYTVAWGLLFIINVGVGVIALKGDYKYSQEFHVVVEDFKNKEKKVYGSACTSYLQRELGLNVDDNGQKVYMYATFSKQPMNNIHPLRLQADKYRDNLKKEISQQHYDVIYTDGASYLNAGEFPELEKNYQKSQAIRVVRYWEVIRWVKKEDDLCRKNEISD